MTEKKVPFIEVKNLVVHYTSEGREIHAVNDVSFSLEKGRTLGLVGKQERERPLLPNPFCVYCRSRRPM